MSARQWLQWPGADAGFLVERLLWVRSGPMTGGDGGGSHGGDGSSGSGHGRGGAR